MSDQNLGIFLLSFDKSAVLIVSKTEEHYTEKSQRTLTMLLAKLHHPCTWSTACTMCCTGPSCRIWALPWGEWWHLIPQGMHGGQSFSQFVQTALPAWYRQSTSTQGGVLSFSLTTRVRGCKKRLCTACTAGVLDLPHTYLHLHRNSSSMSCTMRLRTQWSIVVRGAEQVVGARNGEYFRTMLAMTEC